MDFELLSSLSWREVLVGIVGLLLLYILYAFLRYSRLRSEATRAGELSPATTQSALAAYAAVQGRGASHEESGGASTAAWPTVPEHAIASDPQAQAVDDAPEPASAGATREDAALTFRLNALEQDIAQLRREIGDLHAGLRALAESAILPESRAAEPDEAAGKAEASARALTTPDAKTIAAAWDSSAAQEETAAPAAYGDASAAAAPSASLAESALPMPAVPDISPYYTEAMQLAGQGCAAGEIAVQCGISRAEAELVVALSRNRSL